jgi:hypothetical protein
MPRLPGSEQREGERVIAYWEDKITRLGANATVGALTPDLAAMHSDEWSHRFVVAADSVIEDTALLLYGANFAKLLDIPPERKPPLAIRRWVPSRFFQVFLDGCRDAFKLNAPVRVEGDVPREHGQRELFRAAFIPIRGDNGGPVRLGFGAFNSRLAASGVSA